MFHHHRVSLLAAAVVAVGGGFADAQVIRPQPVRPAAPAPNLRPPARPYHGPTVMPQVSGLQTDADRARMMRPYGPGDPFNPHGYWPPNYVAPVYPRPAFYPVAPYNPSYYNPSYYNPAANPWGFNPGVPPNPYLPW